MKKALKVIGIDNIRCRFGISTYKNIIIVWDEDYDKRVLKFIDKMIPELRKELLLAEEHKGCLFLLWKDIIPKVYKTGTSTDIEDLTWGCDSWCVDSVLAQDDTNGVIQNKGGG